MSILYINPLIDPVTITLLWTENEKSFSVPSHELEFWFPSTLISCYTRFSPWEIWCIVWPGTFTRLRIITLAINTLKLLHPKIILREANIFDIIHDGVHTPILEANRSEYMIRQDGNDICIQKDMLSPGKYIGIAEKKDFTDIQTYIKYEYNSKHITSIFTHIPPQKRLSPIYIKKPHITCQEK